MDRWVEQLGALDYRTREAATKRLIAAGPAAIGPLAKAAQTKDLETSYRAVRVLQLSLDGDELAAQEQAAAVLESLAAGEAGSAADAARDALALYHLTRQDRAVESLRRLGAIIVEEPLAFGSGDFRVILDGNWRGKSTDLSLLNQIPQLGRLRIYYVELGDDAVELLCKLSQINYLDLYGTGMSAETEAKLARALPGVAIVRFSGGMLGVAPVSATIGCSVDKVVHNSAAQAADIQQGDEILSFDGHPVQRFDDLKALIKTKKAGDRVAIEVRHRESGARQAGNAG